MTQKVRVTAVYPDGTAQVIHVRQSACSGECHKCAGCGAAQQTVQLTARNLIGAEPGDLVNIESQTGPVLIGAAVLYMLPLVLFFAGYLAGHLLWQQGAACGAAAFLLAIAVAVIYDRKVAARKKDMYTITGFAKNASQEF